MAIAIMITIIIRAILALMKIVFLIKKTLNTNYNLNNNNESSNSKSNYSKGNNAKPSILIH